jgi:Holliday junction resolvase RusA-like endonuclease
MGHGGMRQRRSPIRSTRHGERVRLSALFFLPDRRRRDYPNLVGSEGMKGLIDGLVDAGVMVDDSITCLVEYGPFTYVYRKGKPGVSVTVEPLD